jgi:integrase/recombinase XerD
MTALAPTLQAFFTDRLAQQRQASSHTIAAYRDALKMLIVFAADRAGPRPGWTSPTWTRRRSARS